MASTFKFHSQINEVVPWSAQYSFPTQQTKVNKQIVKLPPKNGGRFRPGDIVRIEFPADNYLNTLNSVLIFDVTTSGGSGNCSLQHGGAQNIVKRLRVMYGSLVLEDIQEYKTLVRIFTELGVQQDYQHSSGTILDGMTSTGPTNWNDFDFRPGTIGVNDTINGQVLDPIGFVKNQLIPGDVMAVDALKTTRTFALNLLSGLLTSKKLIPLKWMAAQLSIEITLASVAESFLDDAPVSPQVPLTYELENVNYVAELVEFDSTYDQAFFMGLSQGGVPIKFSSWHYHSFNLSGQNYTAQIHERSRSVKAAFAVIRDSGQNDVRKDSDRFFHALKHDYDANLRLTVDKYGGAVNEYQWRVGGRYYPAQPVRCMGGGAEAFVELGKTINILGDYTRASMIDQYSYTSSLAYQKNATQPTAALPSPWSYERLDGKFIIGCEFENTDLMPDVIAGINAEEQSDIALTVKSFDNAANKRLDVFMHFDCLIVVRDGNVVELIM
jgi:hypothetical protein